MYFFTKYIYRMNVYHPSEKCKNDNPNAKKYEKTQNSNKPSNSNKPKSFRIGSARFARSAKTINQIQKIRTNFELP